MLSQGEDRLFFIILCHVIPVRLTTFDCIPASFHELRIQLMRRDQRSQHGPDESLGGRDNYPNNKGPH